MAVTSRSSEASLGKTRTDYLVQYTNGFTASIGGQKRSFCQVAIPVSKPGSTQADRDLDILVRLVDDGRLSSRVQTFEVVAFRLDRPVSRYCAFAFWSMTEWHRSYTRSFISGKFIGSIKSITPFAMEYMQIRCECSRVIEGVNEDGGDQSLERGLVGKDPDRLPGAVHKWIYRFDRRSKTVFLPGCNTRFKTGVYPS